MTDTTAIGRAAEEFVADRLRSQGFEIIARNERTRFYELDIIARKNKSLHFVEVKYRKNSDSGDGLAAVTPAKINRLTRAVTAWLADHPLYSDDEVSLDAAAVAHKGKSYSVQYVANITSLRSI